VLYYDVGMRIPTYMKLRSLIFFCVLVFSSAVLGQQAPVSSAKELFDRGVSFLREGKFADALAAFRESSRLLPTQAATHANMGSALMSLNRPIEAIPAYRDAIRLEPSEGIHRTALCIALSKTNQHSDAVKECEEGVRLSPGSDFANHALLTSLKAAGRPSAELMRFADIVLGRFRDSEVLLAFAADLNYETGNYAYAAELLKRLVALRPAASIYHGMLAEVFLKIERDEEALSEARTALKLEPANPYANYSMGLIFRELGQHQEAAESFGKVQSGNPRLRYAEYYRALSEADRGRLGEGIRILEALTARFPDVFEFQAELGTLLNHDSRYEDAVGPFTKARELKPKSLDAVTGLGLALFESAQLERAIPVLEEALRISPGNEVVTMFLNVTRSRQRLFSQIEDMKRHAKENPLDVEVRRVLVQALAFSRRSEEADPYVKEIYAIRPTDLKVYAYVAVAYETAGKWEKAMEVHLKSLEVGESAGPHRGLAFIYQRRGEFELASASFKKMLELQPNSPDSMVLFGQMLINHGKRREALEIFKRSLALKPANGMALFEAGILSAKLGERDSALQYLEMLRPIRPDLAKALGRCLRLRIWG